MATRKFTVRHNLLMGNKSFNTNTEYVEGTDVDATTLNSWIANKIAIETPESLVSNSSGSSAQAQLKSLQSQYYGEFYKALRNGGTVTIKCRGDSITYGQDTVSGNKRAGIGDTMSNGDVRTTQRAAITYPESLQTAMDEVYGTGKVTVKNEGFSGDNVDLNFIHFATNSKTANVPCMTVIMLGINDAVGTWNTWYDRVDLFIAGYEKIIERELGWGCGVIMMTPPKVRDESKVIDGFANALSALADKYGIPLVDAEEFLANYGTDCFSDGWHMNGKGYEIFGKKVAAMFVGEGGPAKPFVVSNGSRVLTRPTLDNVVYKGATFGSNAFSYTPAEKTSNQGIQAQMTTDEAVIYYSFYTDTDDTVIYPVGYLGCDSVQAGNLSKLDFTLDFGVQQPDYSLDYITGITSNYFTSKPASTVTVALLAGETFFQFALDKPTVVANRHATIHVARKGWHVLAVKFDKINTTSYGGLMGFEVVNYRLAQLIVPFAKDAIQQIQVSSTFTYDPPSLAAGAYSLSAGITVTGAAVGDTVELYPPYDTDGVLYQASVSAANTIKISLFNANSIVKDLASGTWGVVVKRRV